jgi:hypothetical protein
MTTPSTLQEKKGALLGDALRQRNFTNIEWEGVTTNATATEIFLDGGANSDSRLIIPSNTLIIAQGFFVGWNVTDAAVNASGRFALSVTNIAGTVAASGTALEWDAASTDANPFSQYFVGSASSGLVFTYNNTSKSIIATVTGVASKTVRWRARIAEYLSFAL